MTVGVADVDLKRAIGARAPGFVGGLRATEVLFPGVDIVDEQGVVVAAAIAVDWLMTIADQVQFLVGAKAVPGTGKGKGGPRNGFQQQHVFIKLLTYLYICYMDRHVVQLAGFDCHSTVFPFYCSLPSQGIPRPLAANILTFALAGEFGIIGAETRTNLPPAAYEFRLVTSAIGAQTSLTKLIDSKQSHVEKEASPKKNFQ